METFAAAEDELRDPSASSSLVFNVHDKPPWVLSFFLGIQHCLTSIAACVAFPLFLSTALCILGSDPVRDQLVSTVLLVSGISTLFQIYFGIRIPVVQVPSTGLIACILSFPLLFHWSCPSDAELYAMGAANRTAEWQNRMQEIQGAVISVSLLEMFIGYSGLIGLFLYYTSPIVIAPTMLYLSVSLVTKVAAAASVNWCIAIGTFFVLIIFWQCLHLPTPIPWYSSAQGCHFKWIGTFQMFPILICVVPVSFFCWFLGNCELVHSAKPPIYHYDTHYEWFHIPYPFQWGMPRFSARALVAALAATMISLVSSVSSYYSCMAYSGKPPPPLSAMSRGIGAEGFGSLLAGLFGTGATVVTSSPEIATIAITKVGNRRVVMCGAVLMVLLSLLPPFRGAISAIPRPVLGAVVFAMLAMNAAAGLSFLQHVNMKSFRNMFVLGCGLCCPLMIPVWDQDHTTGNDVVDMAAKVLLSSHLFVSSFLTFLLDSIIPGSRKDRGIISWQQNPSSRRNEELASYDCPHFGFCSCRSIRKNAIICVEKVQFL